MDHSTLKSTELFIGGAPRSGTTLLASMLASHKRILGTPESQFKFELAHLFSGNKNSAEIILEELMKNKRFKIWSLPIDKPDVLEYSNLSSFMSSVVHQYSSLVDKSDFSFWVDSTPVNLRHASFLNKEFPNCLFIHLVRDGRAVYASQKKVDFGSNDPVFAALKWMEALCLGLAAEIAFPDKCLRVYYENLVLNPEEECKRICAFMGIEFEENMIAGKGYKISDYKRLTHELVGKKPDPTRINDWKKTLTEKDVAIFESLTYDLLDMLGYERIQKGILKKPNEFSQSKIIFVGALKYLTINKWKQRRRYKRNT